MNWLSNLGTFSWDTITHIIDVVRQLFVLVGADRYWLADWLYLTAWVAIALCVYRAQRTRQINVWDAITHYDHKTKKAYLDARKAFEGGVWLAMTVGFVHMVIQGKLLTTEGLAYTTIYVSAFVAARSLAQRETRLNNMVAAGMNPNVKESK